MTIPFKISALAKQNISCSDITYVVCTHGHSDHIGNNNLFKSAKHIVGYSISEQGDYYHDPQFEDGKQNLQRGVHVFIFVLFSCVMS